MDRERAFRIIRTPLVTEKTYLMIEKENKLAFIVDRGASKGDIKSAVEVLFDVKVERVNVLNTPVGRKAYVKLSPEYRAVDVVSKLGLL
ncbi:MAG: 50S ribosomal protein L23 [Conexivisphaera sp.]|jgi:large subunit ribosomal protein L23|nr:50S ribosomal protein L23 [Conexivisphaerales archaeon]